MSDAAEVERLQELLEACHRFLVGMRNDGSELAEALRATCRAAEARLSELGVNVKTEYR
jgi:hypothetical protein